MELRLHQTNEPILGYGQEWLQRLQLGPVVIVHQLEAIPAELLIQYRKVLNKVEHIRANRYLRAQDRETFVLARSLLRQILAVILDCQPETLSFSFNAWGKPFVDGVDINFNLSHSNNAVAIALSWDDELGVDIEQQQSRQFSIEFLTRCCTSRELKLLKDSATPEADFYALWTLKEAALKAAGKGLSLKLTELELICNKDNIEYCAENLSWLGKRDMTMQLVRLFGNYLCSLVVLVNNGSERAVPVYYEYTSVSGLRRCQPDLLCCTKNLVNGGS